MHAKMQRRRGAYHVLPVPRATPVGVCVMTMMVVMTVLGPRWHLLLPGLCLRLLAHRIIHSHCSVDAGFGQSLCHEQAVAQENGEGCMGANMIHIERDRETERRRGREKLR